MTVVNNILGASSFWIVNKAIAKKVGVKPALLLSELISKREYFIRQDKIETIDGNDYFFCTSEDIEEITTISYKSQRLCIKTLIEAGFINVIQKGLPKRQYFCINDAVILAELEIQELTKGKYKSCQKVNSVVDQRETLYNNNRDNNNRNNNTLSCEKKEELLLSFEKLWDMYQKKVGDKRKLLKKWSALKESEREAIMKHVPMYVESTPDKKYRKNLETYLNNRSWNDEIQITTKDFSRMRVDTNEYKPF